MATDTKVEARLLQVLLWYDGPQIVLLERVRHQYIIAVAIEDEEMHSGFVGAEVSIRQLVEYMLQRVDLRYLYTRPDLRRWWVFDLDHDGDSIPMKRLKASDPLVDTYEPESGFFSRFHDEIKIVDLSVANSIQKFDIDGSWDLGEFSQFYGQVEDIYYLFHSVSEFNNASTSNQRKQHIHDALVRPFRGGGSYVGLYNDFANDNDRAAKLRVSGIQYHSPGYVEVRALKEPFENVLRLLGVFSLNRDEIKEAYRKLHGTLSRNKLLKKESRIYSDELREIVEGQFKELTALLPGLRAHDFMAMAQGDLLVSSKVVLSVVRRVERLFQFFDEGRAKHPEIVIT
jgi:hypothetical protein